MAKEMPPTPPSSSSPGVQGSGRSEQSLAEIREQVERANAEAAAKYGKPDQAAPGGLERVFIHFCLEAYDLGMGELYAELNKDRVLRNVNSGEILVWAGHYWQPDLEGKHLALVERVSAVLLDELSRIHAGIKQAIEAGAKGQTGELERLRKITIKRIARLRTPKGRAACVEFAFTLVDPKELE